MRSFFVLIFVLLSISLFATFTNLSFRTFSAPDSSAFEELFSSLNQKKLMEMNVSKVTQWIEEYTMKFGEYLKGEKLKDLICEKSSNVSKITYFESDSSIEYTASILNNESNMMVKIDYNPYNGRNGWSLFTMSIVAKYQGIMSSLRVIREKTDKETYEYNEKGQLVVWDKYEKDSLISRTKLIYSDDGKEINRNIYNSDGSLSYKYDFDYTNLFPEAEPVFVNYSSEEIVIFSINDMLNILIGAGMYYFNENGDIAEFLWLPNQSYSEALFYIGCFEYEYDEYNNWTKCIVYLNNKNGEYESVGSDVLIPAIEISREIDYY